MFSSTGTGYNSTIGFLFRQKSLDPIGWARKSWTNNSEDLFIVEYSSLCCLMEFTNILLENPPQMMECNVHFLWWIKPLWKVIIFVHDPWRDSPVVDSGKFLWCLWFPSAFFYGVAWQVDRVRKRGGLSSEPLIYAGQVDRVRKKAKLELR